MGLNNNVMFPYLAVTQKLKFILVVRLRDTGRTISQIMINIKEYKIVRVQYEYILGNNWCKQTDCKYQSSM